MRISTDRRSTTTEYSRLLDGDAVTIVAQPLAVLDGDTAYQRDIGIDDIDGIQSTTQTDLEQDHVQCLARNGPFGKYRQCRQGTKFKITERGFTACLIYTDEGLTQDGITDRAAVDTDTLVIVQQVRRCVGTNTIAGGQENGLQHRDTGTLAITAANGDDFRRTQYRRHALPYLREAQGVIINIVDVHSRRPLRDHPVYGAAKAGLAMLTRSLAKDLGPAIRVNGVSPGAILWPESGVSDSVQRSIIKEIALRRPGEPSDVAGAVLFLVRDAPYVTGQILAVDGGRSVGW